MGLEKTGQVWGSAECDSGEAVIRLSQEIPSEAALMNVQLGAG
ncbi:MAG TPA: hypothetical protein VJ768_11130 [Anaerolineales bacterium]|nr:hypothetical protein [Anaerolineales bacterium]